jgi:hypothetical protein
MGHAAGPALWSNRCVVIGDDLVAVALCVLSEAEAHVSLGGLLGLGWNVGRFADSRDLEVGKALPAARSVEVDEVELELGVAPRWRRYHDARVLHEDFHSPTTGRSSS